MHLRGWKGLTEPIVAEVSMVNRTRFVEAYLVRKSLKHDLLRGYCRRIAESLMQMQGTRPGQSAVTRRPYGLDDWQEWTHI